MALIRAERLVKTYRASEVDVPAIKEVNFTIHAKSFVAFVGPLVSGMSAARPACFVRTAPIDP
jgi:ABC-type sugar transport system ATPase subunit